MLDINLLKNNLEEVKTGLEKRGDISGFDFERILELDNKRRELIAKSEELKAKRNKNSKINRR